MYIPTKVQFNLTYDIVFKEVFSDALFASKLLGAILEQDFDLQDVTIVSNELLGNAIDVKNSFFDIRLNILNEYDIDLEMQRYNPHDYSLLERIVFYYSKMISQSVEEGKGYNGKTCISIVFINFSLKGLDKCVNVASLKMEGKEEAISKHKIYVIDLTKSNNCDNLKLKKWIELIRSEELDSFVEGDEIMSDVVKKVHEVNADEALRAKLMSQEKFYRDQEASLYGSYSRGKQEGKLEIAKKMKESNMPLDLISELTSLSVDEISKL
jgi:predicted transposase/invertase (TIGR01784 family)